MKTPIASAAWLAALTLSHASAQTGSARPAGSEACANGAPLAGVVRDGTGATVAEAAVTLEDGSTTQSGADGHFQLRCVSPGEHQLHVAAASFAPFDLKLGAAKRSDLAITLVAGSRAADRRRQRRRSARRRQHGDRVSRAH